MLAYCRAVGKTPPDIFPKIPDRESSPILYKIGTSVAILYYGALQDRSHHSHHSTKGAACQVGSLHV